MALKHAPERVERILFSRASSNHKIEIPSRIPTEHISPEAMDELVDPGVAHGGVIAKVKRPEPPELKSLASKTSQYNGPILVLDGITDPRNVGAIMRSALWFDVPALIVPKHHTAPITSATVKASAGAACLLPVIQVPNLARSLDELKANDIWIYAAMMGTNSQDVASAPLNKPAALVLGDEGRGIRPNVAKRADVQVHIPGEISPELDSLNVSVATGILLAAFYTVAA